MSGTAALALHFRQVHFGGNWTAVNLKDTLAGIDWQQATMKIGSLNTIAALTFHINYYISEVLKVLNGESLTAHDKFSFMVPPIESEKDWKELLDKCWTDAEQFAARLETLPDSILPEYFTDEKYGTYYRNFLGIIEHTHYHLGQISLIKKLAES